MQATILLITALSLEVPTTLIRSRLFCKSFPLVRESYLIFHSELADLLGQVKTPTVSKDEIEKSGLEIIKVDKLREYEAAGKVASNCVDRVCVCWTAVYLMLTFRAVPDLFR